MDWLRARMHLFAPLALVAALLALGVDWVLSDPSPQETLVYVGLAVGGLGFLALKLSVLRRGKSRND